MIVEAKSVGKKWLLSPFPDVVFVARHRPLHFHEGSMAGFVAQVFTLLVQIDTLDRGFDLGLRAIEEDDGNVSKVHRIGEGKTHGRTMDYDTGWDSQVVKPHAIVNHVKGVFVYLTEIESVG